MPAEGLLSQAKRLIVGEPIPSHLAHHERFSRFTGLAVLSSDALSSVAYATEEILRVLVLVSVGVLSFATPIAFIIAAILAIVVFSYRQTIHAYPGGGGAYIVAKDNLGEMPALIAAASLLIDYVLTVAVSIAAGVAALTSAFPQWHVNRVEMTLGFVLVTVQRGMTTSDRQRTRLYRIVEFIGRWSMLDVFVDTFVVALVQLSPLMSVEPGPGVVYFMAVVVLTMFAAMSFDPRLIWDRSKAIRGS